MVVFTLVDDEGEIDTTRFLKDSNELAKFLDKILMFLIIPDDHTSLYFLQAIRYRFFRNFKRVKMSELGKRASEFNIILEYVGENCYIPSGSACFLKLIIYIFKNEFSMEYCVFLQSYNRRTNVILVVE